MVQGLTRTAFISMPMAGKTEEETVAEFERHKAALKDIGYQAVNSLMLDEFDRIIVFTGASVPNDRTSVFFLGKAVEKMAFADVAFFAKGWEKARGCRIEHAVANEYKTPCWYEDEPF